LKINDFNSKVNLPKFCTRLGYTDYQFVRLPTFGWYAYNTDQSFIGNVFEIVSRDDQAQLYALISKEKPEYLDFDLAYSDLSESKLKYNLLETQLWTAAYAMAKREMDTYRISTGGKKIPIKEALAENGMLALIENGVGIITGNLIEKFSMLPWPKKDLRGKFLIPTFCTPLHIASLEYCSFNNIGDLHSLWINDEKGWYGNIKSNNVISDIKEFTTTPGFIWDYKADYWTNKQIVNLSPNLDVMDCIRIWTESQHSAFSTSPLQHIVDTGRAEDLKNYVGKLNYTQLQEAEQITGQKLKAYWTRVREEQVIIGNKTFLKRDNMYYIYSKGGLRQVTNFTVDIEKIVKRGNKFFRMGLLHFGNQAAPFELDESFFTTNYKFHRGIKEKFLKAGLGVPIIDPQFFSQALLIIDSFNSGVIVELE